MYCSMQRHVVAGADPAQVAADGVLPRVGERDIGRLDVALDVLREIRQVHRRPPRVDDVDQHQCVVFRQLDEGEKSDPPTGSCASREGTCFLPLWVHAEFSVIRPSGLDGRTVLGRDGSTPPLYRPAP